MLAPIAAGANAGRVQAAEAPRLNGYTQPHVLRYSSAEDIAGLNPALNQQSAVTWLSQLTMAWLFRFDRFNKPAPELATVVPSKGNGGISADGRTITYHLRKNVRWSDGLPFDADDVKFSFEAINNKANNVTTRRGFELVTKIDEPDKFTLVLHLREPFASFIPQFFASSNGSPALLPKHLLADVSEINTAPYNGLPVGIGPFKYVAWRRGDAVEMEANPLYWRGTPKLRKVVYKIISDRNTALTQLQTGELDLWVPFGGAFLSRVQALPSVAIGRHAVFMIDHFDLNTTRPALRDRAVRQALRYATDRAKILEKVGHGVGILQERVLPEPYPGVANLPFAAFDLAKANAILDRAGWLRAADGVRAKDGVRLSLEFATSSGSPDTDTQLELLRGAWLQAGIEMLVKRYQSSQLFAQYADGGILMTGRFDVVAYGSGTGVVDDLAAYQCGAVPPAGQNTSRYCNPHVDAILAKFQTHYDPRDQARDLSAALRIINDDVPTIVLKTRVELYGYNKDLTGLRPNNVTFFDDMMGVDI